MTSKNLCFRLMREDFKRRIWTVALLFLVLFFSLVIPVIYTGGRPMYGDMDMNQWFAHVTEEVLGLLGGKQPLIMFIMIVSAVVCGVSGFSYLHVSKKVDFYHSIPVKRERLFLVSWVNGIVMMAVIYLLNQMAAAVSAVTFGVDPAAVFSTAIQAYFFHMAFYCLLYTTVVIAMLLTGNIIIALMGIAVFFSYGPAVILLGNAYPAIWFQTYVPSAARMEWMDSLVGHTSPIGYYIVKANQYGQESVAAVVLTVFLITALLAVGACLLYRHRPSEAAGRAMAFRKSRIPIKLLIVMPVTLAFCLFFYALRSTFGWAVFGVLCGALITHCLMEIIYHFDFRKLFAHKIHLILCMAAGLLILCGFKFDLFGYDTYLPGADQIKSAAIAVDSVNNWVSYGSVHESEAIPGRYRWVYEDGREYMLEHMELTDPSDVLFLAEQGILWNEKGVSQDDYYVGSNGERQERRERYWVEYTLKSGRRVRRAYRASSAVVAGTLERIYDSEAYKMGTYPIMQQVPEDIVRVNFQQFNQIEKVNQEIDTAALLAVYQEELLNFTIQTRKEELPIGTIQFVTQDMNRAMLVEYDVDWYYDGGIDGRCYYPVYPSFTKTLQMLRESGTDVKNGLSSEEIVSVNVRDESWKAADYGDRYGSTVDEWIYIITDPEELEAVAPALLFEDYVGMNVYAEDYMLPYVYTDITMKDGRKFQCFLHKEKIPKYLLQKLEEVVKPE